MRHDTDKKHKKYFGLLNYKKMSNNELQKKQLDNVI